jgi:hypothetical protein
MFAMAHLYNLDYGGGTVVLNSGSYRLMDYVPRSGAAKDAYVTETAEIEIGGASHAAIQANIDAVERALDAANRYQETRTGNPVKVVYQPDGYAASMDSEIIDARLELSPGARSTGQWSEKAVRAALIYTRRNYWQGAKTQLAISNPNGTANTTGLRVYNCSDEAVADTSYQRVNWFDLNDIGGDLPAPVEISLKRGGSAVSVGQLHIGALPLTFGEEGAPGSTLLTRECTGGSSQASSSSSGGGFRRYGLTTDYQLFTFAPTALETHLKNHYMGVLARFAAKPPAGVSAYLAPTRHGYRSPTVRLGTDAALQMLDVLQVKAIATGYFNLSAKVDSATADLDADFIVLMPAASYGRIDVSGEYLAVSQPVIFYDNVDPDSPAAYVMQTLVGNNQVDSYRPTSGPGITLVPGRYHRIVMAWTDADGNSPIDDYFDVQLSYYPRRRTL